MAIFRNTNPRIWCDLCKARFGTSSLKGQKPAVWTTISKRDGGNTFYRNYCQDCIYDITHWNCNCGDSRNCQKRYPIEDQIRDYAQAQGKELAFNV